MDHFGSAFGLEAPVDFDLVLPVSEGAVARVCGVGDGKFWMLFIGEQIGRIRAQAA